MSFIIIDAESDKSKLILSLVKKMGARAKKINATAMEDIFFGDTIQKVKTGKLVSKSSVLKKLKSI